MATFDIDQYFAEQNAIALDNAKVAAANSPVPVEPSFSSSIEKPKSLVDKFKELYITSHEKSDQVYYAQNEKIKQFELLNPPTPDQAENNTWVQNVDRWLGNNDQSQNSNSVGRRVVNAAAIATDSLVRGVTAISTLPDQALALAHKSGITNQDILDFNEINNFDEAHNPETLARLNSPANLQPRRVIKGISQARTDAIDPITPSGAPVLTRLDNLNAFFDAHRRVTEATKPFDTSEIIDKGYLKDLTNDPRSAESLAKVAKLDKAYQDSIAKGEYGSAALSKLKSVTETVTGSVADLKNHPEVIIPAVAGQAGNLLAAIYGGPVAAGALNWSTAGLNLAEGLDNRTSTPLPSKDEIDNRYLATAAHAGLETGADLAGAGLFTAGKGLVASAVDGGRAAAGKTVLTAAEKEAAKVGLLQAATGVTTKAAESTLVEGVAEHFQSPLEDIAQGKPIDLKKQRISAVLGLGGGLGLGGPTAVLAGVAEGATRVADRQAAQQKEAMDFYQASTNNDASAYTDPTSKTYDPVKAAGVWFTHSQQATTTPETKAENLAKVTELQAQMQAEVAANQTSLKEAINTPQAKSAILDQIEALHASLAEASPGQVLDLKNNPELDALWAQHDRPDLAPAEVASLKSKTSTLEKQLEQITAMRTRLDLEAGAQGSQDAINAQRASTEVPVAPVASTVATPPAATPVNQTVNQTVTPAAPVKAPTPAITTDTKAFDAARNTTSTPQGPIAGPNFPVMYGNSGFTIPTAMVTPYGKALNSQSVGKLASRGGIAAIELLSAMLGKNPATGEVSAQVAELGLTNAHVTAIIQKLGNEFATNPGAVDKFIAGYPATLQSTLAPADTPVNQTANQSPLPASAKDIPLNPASRIGDLLDLQEEEHSGKNTAVAILNAIRHGVRKGIPIDQIKNDSSVRPHLEALQRRAKTDKIAKEGLEYFNKKFETMSVAELAPESLSSNAIANDLRDKEVPLDVLLQHIINENKDPELTTIAKNIIKVVGRVMVSTQTKRTDASGLYNPGSHSISITKSLLKEGDVNPQTAEVVLHEGAHAATMKALVNNPVLRKKLYDLMEHIAATNPEMLQEYGLTNTAEFLAEGFASARFRQKLKEIAPTGLNKSKFANAWAEFVDLIRKALGLPVSARSALTELMELGNQAMKETGKAKDKRTSNQEYSDAVTTDIAPIEQLLEPLEAIKNNVQEAELKSFIGEVIEVFKRDSVTNTRLVKAAEDLRILSETAPEKITKSSLETSLTTLGYELPNQNKDRQVSADTTVDNTEKTLEEQNASVPEALTNKDSKKETNAGGLDVLNQPVSPKGTAYNLRNVITDYFTQNAGKDTNGTQRPLVKVRDFLSSLLAEPTLAEQFVKGKKLEERQEEAVKFFAKTAKAWLPTIQEALFKKADPTYYATNDPLQFLYIEVLDANGKPTGKFDADENFKTAIAYAAFSTIQDMAGNGELNSQATINKMLGRLADHEVTPEEWKALGRIGTLEDLLANAAGQVAYEALGLQVKNMETWNNLPAQIKTSMGAHVMKLLIEQGYIERHRINATEISAMRGFSSTGGSDTTTNYTGLENLSYFTLAREGKLTDLQRPLTGELQQIVDSVKGTQGILDKVFSIESATRWPSLEPLEPHQVNAKNSDQLVPDTLGTIINKKLKEVNKLRQDVWEVLEVFSKDFTLEMMGKADSTQAQKGRRLSVEAKNQSLEREFDQYRELGTLLLTTGDKDLGLGQPYFLDYSVWKQHRVGIATNGFNPNSSKAHRQLSYQPDWETEIDRNDSAQMDNFYLGVAEGFGIATDNVPNAVSLVTIKDRFAQADVIEAVELLRQRLADEKSVFTDAEQQKIVSLVKKGKENLHSLNSLIALAHFSEAVKTNSDTFTVQIPAERDGKTNGPMLANAFFGVGSSPAELFKTLNRGGFFEVGNPDTQFNIWKGKGNLDLYEKGTGNLLKTLQWLIAEKKVFGFIKDTVQVFTKSLTDPKTGDVNSVGRNMMKKPTQEVVYGSSSKTTVDNMAQVFIESVYARIEEVAKDDLSHMTLPKLIKELNSLLYGTDTKFTYKDTAQTILDKDFSSADITAMKDKFIKTLGKAVKETVKSDFHAFNYKTQIFTATAGLTFSIYKAVYDTARKDYIKELTELGEFDVNPAFERRGKNGKMSQISAKQTHDLNAAQEKVLKERVLAVYPIVHSLFSKESNQLEAGLFISKTERKLSKDPNYQVEVQFGTPIKDVGESRVSMAAMQTNQVGPGVAMLPNLIQASDSYISHSVQAAMNALNQHDALITGLGKTKETAQLLNAGTWKLLLNYSPATEMYESFVRNILGMESMLAKKEVSKDVLALFAASIVEQTYRFNGPESDVPIDPHEFLGIHLAMMKNMSFHADSMKFSTLGLTASIDQYTFEGGNFAVGEKLREEALAKKAELVSGIDPETKAAVDSLEQRLQTAITQATIAANEKIKEISDPEAVNVTGRQLEDLRTESREDASINDTVADHLTNAQAFALLSHAVKDKSLGEAVVGMLKEVMTKLREAKGAMNLVTALKVLQPANRAEIAQLLIDRASKIPANLWGEQGRPFIKSDSQWVSFFEKRGNVKGEQLVRALRDRLVQDGGPSNVKDFNLEMLNRISKLISPTLTIRYVTPATAPSQVIEQAKDNARAWYIATTDGVDTIYVLSTDFKHSGLTTETLLHEILHSAVARTIKSEQDARKANPARKSALLDIIDDLEGLRKAAEKFIAADPELAAKYGPAVKDIDELIAWGMTNLTFQQEVLNKIQVASRTNNGLIAGFKAMVNSLVAILFKKTEGREQEILGSGLSVLISNVSDLFTEAENKQSQTINETLNRSQTNTAPDPAFYTTSEIYDSLSGVSPAPLAFDSQLRDLLSGIVNKLHGTAGVLHESLMDRQALSAQDVYLKALATGQAPFASATIASGFQFSQQEGFVIEQVEATVRAAIDRNENTQSFAYKGLDALYNEAKAKLSPKDFHQGDWNTATQIEKDTAQELYDFLFVMAKAPPSTNPSTAGNTNANSDRLAHLSRFAAMGLAHEGVNKLLQGMTGSGLTTTAASAPTSLLARLKALFDQILAWFSDKQAGINPGDKPDARLEKLVDTLVGIEAKKRASAMARENALFKGLQKVSDSVLKAANTGISKAGAAAARSNNGAVKGAGFVINAVSGGRVNQMIDNGMKYFDTLNGGKPNVLTDTVAYVRGPNAQMEELFRMGKKLEADRRAFIDNTSMLLLAAYRNGGKDLTQVQKKAITSLVRSDAQSLLAAGYTMAQLAEFLGNGTQRQDEITKIEDSLKALHPQFYKQFLGQSKQLAFILANGKATHENSMLNALNIARMYNTPTMGHLTVAEEAAVQALVDPLVSLWAIEYSPTVLRETARDVLLDESARPNGENGVAATLAMHAHLLKDSKDKVFDGSEVLRRKGYIPEVYNPRTDIQVAGDVEGQDLINKGYSAGEVLPKDRSDPDPTVRRLYVREDSGMVAHVTGMISLKDMKAKGSAQIGKNQDTNTWVGQLNVDTLNQVGVKQQAAIAWMAQNGDTFDPTGIKGTFMIPTLNSYGEPSNYRYEMSHVRKDAVLERNNNFEHVLGVFAGNTFDKITSAQHNAKVIQALHDHYKVDYAGRSMSYVEVGPNSQDPAMREVYRLLPEATKKEIKRVWGTEAMLVRNDMMNLTFGYRKFSLSEMFDKDPSTRNAYEDLFVSIATFVVAGYARLQLGMDPAQAMQYAKRTGVIVKRAEDAWKTISDETKNAIVVKTGIVMMGNVWSNATLLMMHDISLIDIAKHHKTAFTAAREYQEVSEELFKAQTQLDTNYNVGNRRALEQRILVLKDKIARNPVTELMDAGLMPTIVRDVDLSDDMYAYDSNFVKNIKANVAAINPTVLNIGKQLYMTKDTPHYKMLADLTQMSDFVARYTLYQHLTTKSQDPLSKKEAARVSSESFVNYDIPLPKGIQYLDDIGILPFTKYFLSMQRVLVNLVREHPVKVLMTLLANNYLHLMPTVMDGSAFSRFGNNPIRSGPLRFIGAVEHILPIKYAMGLFR